MPCLSIIIPVFNVKPFIGECLDRLLIQDLSNVEIILVDDGSTDGSGVICDDFARNHPLTVKVIHKTNEGVGIARNCGIELATGDWISFIDPDDFVDSTYISAFYSLTTQADLVFFSLVITARDGRSENKVLMDQYFEGPIDMQSGVFRMMFNDQRCEFFAFTVNKFFRRKIIMDNHIRFIPHMSFREDELFTLDYYNCIDNFLTSSQCLYYYRIDIQGSLSHKKKPIDELVLYIDNAIVRFDRFTDFNLKSLEFDRLLHYLIHAYDDKITDKGFEMIYSRVRFLTKERRQFLKHLKKIKLLKIIFSLPSFISRIALKGLLKKFYQDNTKHKEESFPSDKLW